MGADARLQQLRRHLHVHADVYSATPTASGGDAFASFLLGFPASGAIVYATPAEYLVDYYAGFAQDEFRMGALTLNYGLRYEYEAGVREANNAFTVGSTGTRTFRCSARHGVEGRPDVCGSERLSDTPGTAVERVAPRAFAWSVTEQQGDPRRLRLLLGADAVLRRR